ncbi:hydroxysqualene dehydroxylase HpnE [soil metagenome]
MSAARHVLIAGGGLAGIAAAVALAQARTRVTLIETRKKLGGRATSFADVRSGETLDNCQHVVLGCCTNYLSLLDRLDARRHLRWTHTQHWIEPGGRTSMIAPGMLPAPLHFLGSVLGARFLSLGEKIALGRAMRTILKARRAEWRTRTFADFLTAARQPERLVRRFWAPVVVSACNLNVERVCAAAALQVFQEGFLASATAADVGLSAVPLVELYAGVEAIIAKAGGTLRLGCSVARLDATQIVTTTGETISADRVICALPPERAAEVASDALRAADGRFDMYSRLTHSPILGVHLRFDRGVLKTPHAVLVDGSVQWLFRKDDTGHALHAVISAADDWMALTEAEIAERVRREIAEYLPAARDARLLWARAVKEKRATFAVTPEAEALRPPPLPAAWRGPVPAVILAGDAVQTGWPATMEGAVRSGYAAAALALARSPREFLTPDARISGLYSLLARAARPRSESPLIVAPESSRPGAGTSIGAHEQVESKMMAGTATGAER